MEQQAVSSLLQATLWVVIKHADPNAGDNLDEAHLNLAFVRRSQRPYADARTLKRDLEAVVRGNWQRFRQQ